MLHRGARVDKYIENEDSASIEVNGKTYTADVILGADGEPLSLVLFFPRR